MDGVSSYACADLFEQRERNIMTLPRCGNDWDVSKTPCSRCGLLVRLPNHSGAAARTQNPPPKPQPGSGNLAPGKQQLHESSSFFTSSSSKPTSTTPTSLPKSQWDGAAGPGMGSMGGANSSRMNPAGERGERNVGNNTTFPNASSSPGRDNDGSGRPSGPIGSGPDFSYGRNRVSSPQGDQMGADLA